MHQSMKKKVELIQNFTTQSNCYSNFRTSIFLKALRGFISIWLLIFLLQIHDMTYMRFCCFCNMPFPYNIICISSILENKQIEIYGSSFKWPNYITFKVCAITYLAQPLLMVIRFFLVFS